MMTKLIPLLLILSTSWAGAAVLLPETRLAQATISETLPTAFAPFDFTLDDFEPRWEGPAPIGVELGWVPGSLQWVRVNDVLVVPRARLRVKGTGARVTEVVHAGFSQLAAKEASSVEVPVALLSSGADNGIRVRALGRENRVSEGRVRVAFKGGTAGKRTETDASCSRFGLSIELDRPAQAGWLYAGCRLIEVTESSGTAASLEIQLLWDGAPGAGEPLQLLRAGPESGVTEVERGGARARISYRLPSRIHHAFLGLGVGPYHYHFEGGGDSSRGWSAMPTLYAAYAFTETTRAVAFDAITFNPYLPTDLGFYLSTEQVRTIDRRVSVNLMLGIHFTGFRSRGKYTILPGAPQGLEIVGYDVFKRGHNLVVGGFVYPGISGKAYYNFWLRWGSSGIFGEFNYISWREEVDAAPFLSRSIGLSLGFPVARFL